MAVSFAGSRSLDARRRRRLATDQVAPDAKPRARAKPKKLYINPIEELQKRVKNRAETPVHSLIPSSVRKFTLLNLALVGAWLLLLAVSLTQVFWAPFVAPKLAEFFEPQTGMVWPMWTGLMFLITAQFSWLVYWYRRHSRRDFHGHYRIWLWTSVDWVMMGLGAMTGLHKLVSETLIRLTHLPRDPYENLLWIAPLAGILVNLGHGLDREMASSKVGWRMFCVALSSSALVGMTLIGWRPFGNEVGDLIFMTMTSSFVPLALLIATLNQLYFVLYVTPESVRKQGGMLSAAGKRVTSSTSKFFLSSLLTTGWMFRGMGRAYRVVMSLLFSVLLWKKIEIETDKTKKPKPKAKTKAAPPVKESAPTSTSGRGKSRKAVVVEEEPVAEEEVYEEEAAEEAYEEEVREEEAYEEELVEEEPEPEPAPPPPPVKATAKQVEAKPAAPKEPEWDQSAWEAEMRAYEDDSDQGRNSKGNNSRNNQQSNSKNKKNQRFDQKHDSYSSSSSKYEQQWQEPEPEPAYSAPAQSSYDEEQWQNEDAGGDDYSEGLDPSDLRGMSKKDKRKLRKQMRDQQRGH